MTIAWNVPGLPFTLSPHAEAAWTVAGDPSIVTGSAAARSDIFIDPAEPTAESTLDAATLLGVPPAGDFQLSARVTVEFASTYDAGVLLVWMDERHWGKLCFELSPDGEPMIVSVIARGVADDANAFVVDGRSVWLRVSRLGRAFAYHASLDGTTWKMIRYFAIDGTTAPATLGFEVQSPTGDGCVATFDDIRFTPERLRDLRDGS